MTLVSKERFKYMQATIEEYDDGTIVFYSYFTPIIIRHNFQWITSPVKYSPTTTRQKNRFISDREINPTVVEHEYFVKVLNILGINRGYA